MAEVAAGHTQRLSDLRQEAGSLDIAIGRLRQDMAAARSSETTGLRKTLARQWSRTVRVLGRGRRPQAHFAALAAERPTDDPTDPLRVPTSSRLDDPERILRLTSLAVAQKRATVALLRGELDRSPTDRSSDPSEPATTPDRLVHRGSVIPDDPTVARLVGRIRTVGPADPGLDADGEGQRRPTVTVAIRFHDVADLPSLERCLVALLAQQGVELTVLVVFQGSDETELRLVRDVIAGVWLTGPTPRLVPVPNPDATDIRSALLNRALEIHYQETSNDFFYVLDHDDLVFSHALATMATPIVGGEAAVSFGKVMVARYVGLRGYEFLYRMGDDFKGTARDITELAIDNFFPIHGYIYHTRAMPQGRLRFNERMDRLEDYEALLRVVTAYPVYIGAIDALVGLYCWRGQRAIDGPIEGASEEEAAHWDRNRHELAKTFVEIATMRAGGR